MHGCYNAVGLWFVQGLAGIDVDHSRGDGYTIVIRAGVDAVNGNEETSEDQRLTWASGTRSAPQGLVHSSWTANAGEPFFHNVTIPGNGVARVLIPAVAVSDVKEGGKPLPADVKVLGNGTVTINEVQYVALAVGSGTYRFSSSWAPATRS